MSEIAWAAGLFEGRASASNGRRLQLKMTREDCVRRFHDAVGVGKVFGPYGPYEGSVEPHWLWVAWNLGDIEHVRELLQPFQTEEER